VGKGQAIIFESTPDDNFWTSTSSAPSGWNPRAVAKGSVMPKGVEHQTITIDRDDAIREEISDAERR